MFEVTGILAQDAIEPWVLVLWAPYGDDPMSVQSSYSVSWNPRRAHTSDSDWALCKYDVVRKKAMAAFPRPKKSDVAK